MTRFAWLISSLTLFLVACADTTGLTSLGGPCTDKSACTTGLCVMSSMYGQDTGWQDGTCTAECAGTTCAEGVCVALQTTSYCLTSCTRASDCRQGYVCDLVAGACLPDCQKGFSCGAQLACQTDGTCRTATTTSGACTSDADCVGSTVCPGAPPKGCGCASPPGGTKACRAKCSGPSDCPPAPSGASGICTAAGLCG